MNLDDHIKPGYVNNRFEAFTEDELRTIRNALQQRRNELEADMNNHNSSWALLSPHLETQAAHYAKRIEFIDKLNEEIDAVRFKLAND